MATKKTGKAGEGDKTTRQTQSGDARARASKRAAEPEKAETASEAAAETAAEAAAETATEAGDKAEASGAEAQTDKRQEKEALRAQIKDLKAELKNIHNKMIRSKTIGEQNVLKNEQKVKQRQLFSLQSKLKHM